MSNFLENKSSKKVPFLLPKNYFELLPQRIWERIQAGQGMEQDETTGSNYTFNVPQDYFDKLENSILQRIALENVSATNEEAFIELVAPTLFVEKKTNPFQVPAGYFQKLESTIQERIWLESQTEEDLDAGLKSFPLSNQSGMEVPAGYFKQLEEKIVARIQSESVEEELESLYFSESAPLLSRIPKSNPFGVPQSYFQKLDQQVSEKLETKTETQILNLKPSNTREIIRYLGISVAVAAALFLVFNLIDIVFNGSNSTPKVASTLQKETKTNAQTVLPVEDVVEQTQIEAVVSFDEEDIAEAVADNFDLSDLASIGASEEEPSSDEIIDYLVETDIDLQSIDL
jgi:hypothetical protein